MRTTIDKAGRIVVPKSLRDELGLTAGQDLEIEATANGSIEIRGGHAALRLVRDGDRVRVVADEEIPPLTDAAVRAAVENSRR